MQLSLFLCLLRVSCGVVLRYDCFGLVNVGSIPRIAISPLTLFLKEGVINDISTINI